MSRRTICWWGSPHRSRIPSGRNLLVISFECCKPNKEVCMTLQSLDILTSETSGPKKTSKSLIIIFQIAHSLASNRGGSSRKSADQEVEVCVPSARVARHFQLENFSRVSSPFSPFIAIIIYHSATTREAVKKNCEKAGWLLGLTPLPRSGQGVVIFSK